MSRTRYRIGEDGYPYFLTSTIVGWLPVFTRQPLVDIVLQSWRFLAEKRGITFLGYVIMENHFHCIASGQKLGEVFGDSRSYTARRIVDWLSERGEQTLLRQLKYEKDPRKVDRDYQVWQEGLQPKQVDHDDMMWQKLNYIHMNPVRRGYVDEPLHWRYSSARNYAGMNAMFPVDTTWR